MRMEQAVLTSQEQDLDKKRKLYEKTLNKEAAKGIIDRTLNLMRNGRLSEDGMLLAKIDADLENRLQDGKERFEPRKYIEKGVKIGVIMDNHGDLSDGEDVVKDLSMIQKSYLRIRKIDVSREESTANDYPEKEIRVIIEGIVDGHTVKVSCDHIFTTEIGHLWDENLVAEIDGEKIHDTDKIMEIYSLYNRIAGAQENAVLEHERVAREKPKQMSAWPL